MWIQRKSSRNTQKICINTRRKIRGNFCAKHFGFLAIFRALFNKQAIIIRVFQYFLLFFLVSCDMFCIICQRSSGVGFFRFGLPGACVVVWCWLLYCRAKPDQVSAKNLRFKTINDTKCYDTCCIENSNLNSYPTNTHACVRDRDNEELDKKRVRQKQLNYNYNVKFCALLKEQKRETVYNLYKFIFIFFSLFLFWFDSKCKACCKCKTQS